MRKLGGLLGMALILTVLAGTLFGSEYEKRRGKEYREYKSYESEFYGTVEELPNGLIGIWRIDGKKVEVTKDTYIKEEYGKAKVGAYVEVKGKRDCEIFKVIRLQ